MNNINKSLSINETFIIDSIEGSDVMSACTALYTNNILSCSGNSEIMLSNNLISFNTNTLATIISATTYYGDGSHLTGISNYDTFITGGTYSNGTATFRNNSGGTFSVIGFYTGGTDVYVTGGTFNNGSIIFKNNTGGTFSVTGLTSGQNLQQVTDLGDTTTNSINIINDDSVLTVQNSDSTSYSALYNGQLNIVTNLGEQIIGIYSDNIYFTKSGNNKTLSSGTFNNSNGIYNLPDKISGSYTLATTSDLTGFTSGQTLQQITTNGNITSNDIILSGNNNILVSNIAGDAGVTIGNDVILISSPNGFGNYYSNSLNLIDTATGGSIYITPQQNTISLNSLTLDYSLADSLVEPIQYFQNKDGIIALLSDISGATSGLTLQSVTDNGNTTNNPIVIYNGPDNVNLTSDSIQINKGSIGQQSLFTNGAWELGDLNGSTGYANFVVDAVNNSIGFNFQNNAFAGSTNIILAPEFYTNGNSFNTYYIPFKAGNSSYTLATIEDISGATSGLTQNLQSVTDNGNTTNNPIIVNNGTARIQLGDDGSGYPNGILLFDDTYYLGQEAGLYANFAWEIKDQYGEGGTIVAESNTGSDIQRISFQHPSGSAINLRYATPVTYSNVDLLFPVKSSGVYTIATTQDYTLQNVTDIGNITNNNILIESAGQSFINRNNDGSNATYQDNDGFRILIDSGFYTSTFNVQGIGFTEDTIGKTFSAGTFNNSNSVYSLPDKVTGNYILATLNDLTGATGNQNLQQVTDIGNETTNNVIITSDENFFLAQSTNGQFASNLRAEGMSVTSSGATVAGTVLSNLIRFNNGINFKELQAGTFTNSNDFYQLPDKPAGEYMIATIDDIDNSIATGITSMTLQQVTTNGNITSNDIVIESSDSKFINRTSDNSYSTQILASEIRINGGAIQTTLSSDTLYFVNDTKTKGISYGSFDNYNAGLTFNLPDKSAGGYTLATTDDIPSLQQVTDVGSNTTNSINITSDLGWFLIQDVSGQNTSYMGPSGFQNIASSGLYSSVLNTNSLIFNDGIKQKSLSKGNYINTGGIYQLPDKPSATYTLAVTSDITDRYVTGGTFNKSSSTLTFINNSGNTFSVTGLTDNTVTGGTYSNGTAVFTNNTGGTFSISGFSTATQFTGGTINSLTATTISATTYLGLPTDIRITGGTYSNGTAIYTNNTGGTFSVSGFSTGATWGGITGSLSNQTDLYGFLIALSAVTTGNTISINNKINGSGITNFISKWSGSTGLTNSVIYDDGTNVSIGTTTGTSKVTIESSGITTTTNDTGGILLKNPTLATGLVQSQHSPAIVWDGNAWVGGATNNNRNLKWKLSNNVTPGIGTNVEGKLEFQVNTNNAGWVTTGISLQIDRFGSVSFNAPIITSGVLGGLTTLSINKTNGSSPSDGLSVGGAAFLTTTGANYGGNFTIGAAPTSGSMVFNSLASQPTINQTGSASGITRGFYVNPTITSAVDFRGVEVTNGSIALPISSGIGSAYSVKNNDYMVNVTGGTFTVTLPTATTCRGRIYIIKNSGTGTVTLATTSSQTIDGVTTKTMNIQYGVFQLMSDGSNWIILSQI